MVDSLQIYPKLQEKHVVLCGLSSIEDATSLSETLESIQKDIREIFNPEKSPSLLKSEHLDFTVNVNSTL